MGPIDAADYLVLFDQLEALERSLVETSRAITNALGTKASAAAKRPLFKALAWAAEGLDAVYEIDARGCRVFSWKANRSFKPTTPTRARRPIRLGGTRCCFP